MPNLPISIVPGQSGHIDDHEALHAWTRCVVTRFGAVGDGVTDDTAAIQAAFDAAHAAALTDTSFSAASTAVLFPPGTYRITSGLTWKCHHIRGIFPNVSVRFKWDGAAGGTCITRDMSVRGGGSFVELSGIHFKDGTNRPAKWISMTSSDFDVQVIDKFLYMHHVNFEGSTGNAVQLNAHFVNAHFEHLRWDATGGYAIELVAPDNLGNLGTLLIDKFTYDHNRSGDSAAGMIHINNTQGSSNLGTVTLRGGRIETNIAWGTFQAVVVVTATVGHSVKVHLEDVTFQDVGSLMASDCLLYHNGTAAGEYLQLTNVHAGSLSAVVGGTLPATYPSVPVKAGWAYANIHGDGAVVIPFHTDGTAQGIEARGTTTSGTYPIRVFRSSETVPRLRVRNNGAIEMSDGTTQDISISRGAANRIDLADGNNLAVGTTTGTKIGTATTQKLGFFNATPVVQPAANADTSGATLAALETEVNELKATLRTLGLMAT